ncbi:tetratricopeptide repeat protein [Paracoccus sediminis]|uniref:Tetratricopeptide repeat-containing protein n=2 Tax=Paracoccus sediminis TaxID=1214787 RepID=A0A238VZY4_9RHOB|nr:tetratricopeptide repeat protein [Paracoccus sediminis]SNR39453.1 Tetratricopeptide repeat-containing protein [Paracoccus sediminis]
MSLTRPNPALIAAVLAALSLPAAAQNRPEPRPQDEAPAAAPAAAPAVALGTAPEAKAPAEPAPLTFGLAGPFLAARMATVENDFLAAARFFVQAVAHDPEDRFLQDSALVALVSAGEIDRAADLAKRIGSDGEPTELSRLIDRAERVHEGDWAGLLAEVGTPTDAESQADLLAGMLRGWGLLGAGKAKDALAEFERLARLDGVAPMVNYHLALARALVGDYEGAESLLADETTGAHILGFAARAQILVQLERRDEATAMIEAIPGVEAEPQLLALRDRIASGQPVPFDVVKTPADGIAQVFLTFASALASSPDPEPLSLIHARLAAWLSPETAEARLMVAQILQERQQFDLAEPEFDALRRMGQMRPAAELVRIDTLSRADRIEEAGKAALSLTAAYPDLPQAWIALGDLLRQQEKFAQAVPAYDKALALLEDAPADARWFPLYARGIALERSQQFDRAEADFLAAIEIRPNQASLLNYLGYSWIDRNENLDHALGLIQKAVELSPDDGYILDSLAWAYYRLGRFDEAVAPMEAAILTMSQDPLVNDHLGDIYWKVGRQREAEIQWQRVLSLKPTETDDVDPDRIRAKLDRGLDAVLAEESAAGTADTPAPVPQAANN